MNPIEKLHSLGQSLWYDNIQRGLLQNRAFQEMIARGEIRGMTSNPSIFNNAIAKSDEYDSAIVPMAWAGCTARQILDQLVLEDIRTAADLFLPLYKESQGGDGYISVEVSPTLAHDTAATLAEAHRLWELVNHPNVMVKIPATQEGIPAIRQAIADGININITLIFSLVRYLEVINAYLAGLEERVEKELPVDHIASVASFFVSRIDTKVDLRLDAIIHEEGSFSERARALLGKLAIASARLAYAQFRSIFEGPRFTHLQAHGARLQRPLWASTSTKNPAYPGTLYVDSLIGPNTVNTIPPQTLDAFRDHGTADLTIEQDVAGARRAFDELAAIGISIDQVTQELEDEGVKAFADSFSALLTTIENRRLTAVKELGPLAAPVAQRVTQFQKDKVATRLFRNDPTLWTPDRKAHEEIRSRLGWLTLPEKSRIMVPDLVAFADEIRQAGYTHALLLGMGGSSLAPEVMRLVSGVAPGYLDLTILDSTDPAQVGAAAHRSPVKRTLYIVSSKSGGTAEVNAFLDYFWARARKAVGKSAAEHFIAITDPGTSLEKIARERHFRRILLADPTVGGRYSALSAFGLVPATLLGLDVEHLLNRASRMYHECTPEQPAVRNPGLVLGTVLGEAALNGRDKLTLIADPRFTAFGSWLEQLVAESSGKQGQGIVPVDGEPLGTPDMYSSDRLFIYLRQEGRYDQAVSRLGEAGHPVLTFDVKTDDLGAEFYRWCVAVAVACIILEVNAFDQPDVQDSKTRTLAKIDAYRRAGKLDEGQPLWESEGVRLYGSALSVSISMGEKPVTLADILTAFLAQARSGDYVALNAYLPRNRQIGSVLRRLRSAIMKRTHLATTIGFGPRFLHSTGQLHKGGPNNGLFIQITADPVEDVIIPEEGITFATLERAQALGDLESLIARGRRVVRVHLSNPQLLMKVAEIFK